MFATLDINTTGVVFGEDLSKKSRNIMLKSGKLFSELASIYLYFD